MKRIFLSLTIVFLVFGVSGVGATQIQNEKGTDITVHGSRANGTALPTSDLDIAVRVSPTMFDEIAYQLWGEKTYQFAVEKYGKALRQGKISAADVDLINVKQDVQSLINIKTQISIIKIDGPFDQGPFIQVP